MKAIIKVDGFHLLSFILSNTIICFSVALLCFFSCYPFLISLRSGPSCRKEDDLGNKLKSTYLLQRPPKSTPPPHTITSGHPCAFSSHSYCDNCVEGHIKLVRVVTCKTCNNFKEGTNCNRLASSPVLLGCWGQNLLPYAGSGPYGEKGAGTTYLVRYHLYIKIRTDTNFGKFLP